MAGRSPLFRQADLERVLRAAAAAGLEVLRTEVAPDGRIIVIHERGGRSSSLNSFDDWKAARDARKS